MARISKARKQKTRHLMEAEILSDEHILHLAKQAVAKVRVPPGIMTYEERLASALYGIANGYWKFNPENFQSTREWLSMQAYYQIKTDAAKRTRTLSRETAIEEPERIIATGTKTPQRQIENEEKAEAVRKLLLTLNRRDRAIVTRVCLQGETFTRVAKSFRMSRYEVQKRYKEAMGRLREVAVYATELARNEKNQEGN